MTESYGDDDVRLVHAQIKGYRHDAESILTALSAAGRLLPPGGEVGEEWSARWTPNAEMAAKGYEVEQAPAGSRERAESLARRYGNDEDGTVELLRRRKYVGPWSPVVSDNSEGESSG